MVGVRFAPCRDGDQGCLVERPAHQLEANREAVRCESDGFGEGGSASHRRRRALPVLSGGLAGGADRTGRGRRHGIRDRIQVVLVRDGLELASERSSRGQRVPVRLGVDEVRAGRAGSPGGLGARRAETVSTPAMTVLRSLRVTSGQPYCSRGSSARSIRRWSRSALIGSSSAFTTRTPRRPRCDEARRTRTPGASAREFFGQQSGPVLLVPGTDEHRGRVVRAEHPTLDALDEPAAPARRGPSRGPHGHAEPQASELFHTHAHTPGVPSRRLAGRRLGSPGSGPPPPTRRPGPTGPRTPSQEG